VISFLLEYDTGTEHLGVLAGKLDGYYVLAAGLAWHEQASPVLLFCFGSPRREQGARRALAATRQAADLRIATASIDPRLTSPAGPVWLPVLNHAPPSAADRPGRCHSRPLAPVSGGPGARAPPGRRTRASTAPRRGRRARSVGRRGGVPMMPVLITCHRRVCSPEGCRCRAIG